MEETSKIFEYIENDKCFIFDTGSPFSINYKENELGHTVKKLYPGIDKDLRELLKKDFDGIIGMDNIQQYNWRYDRWRKEIKKVDSLKNSYNIYALENYMGIPVVEVIIFDQKLRFWLDTGSSVNYIKDMYLPINRNLEVSDFSPLMGWFNSTGIKTSIEAFNIEMENNIYAAPTMIETIMGDKIDGILGYSFMSWFNWTLIKGGEQIQVPIMEYYVL